MTTQRTFDDFIATPLESHHGAKPIPPQPAKQETGERRLARRSDPPASKRAASAAVSSGLVADHVTLIEGVVLAGGGWTGPEIAKAIGLELVQVARRLSTIPSIRKADSSCDRKCAVSGKRLSTYWARANFETEE
jgi:hypothetical protein